MRESKDFTRTIITTQWFNQQALYFLRLALQLIQAIEQTYR